MFFPPATCPLFILLLLQGSQSSTGWLPPVYPRNNCVKQVVLRDGGTIKGQARSQMLAGASPGQKVSTGAEKLGAAPGAWRVPPGCQSGRSSRQAGSSPSGPENRHLWIRPLDTDTPRRCLPSSRLASSCASASGAAAAQAPLLSLGRAAGKLGQAPRLWAARMTRGGRSRLRQALQQFNEELHGFLNFVKGTVSRGAFPG